MAGTEVGSLYYDLDIDDSKMAASLDSADKQVKDFGKSTEKTGEEIKASMNKAAAGFAVAGAGLGLITKNALDFTVDLVKSSKGLAREIGVSTEEASRLTAAFGRMGIEADTARASFGIFSKNIVASTENSEKNRIANERLQIQINGTKREIADTTYEITKNGDKTGDLNQKLSELNNTLLNQQNELKKNADGFAKLGVSTKDATGKQKDFTTILFEVADRFKTMPAGVDKTALALELFGRQGKDMIKILDLGSDGIKDLEKNADALGLTLSANTINKVNELVRSQKLLKEQTDSLKIAIGTATAPLMTAFNTALVDVTTSLLAADSPLRGVTAGFFAFAPPVFTGAAAVLSFTANMVTAAPAIGAVTTALGGLTALSITGWTALIVADLALIVGAAMSVTAAFDAMNDAANSQADMENSNLAVRSRLQALSQTGDAGQRARAQKALAAGIGLNAEGTDNWRGGPTWLHEKGPEIVNLPRGSQVIPNKLSEKMVKKSNNKQVSNTTVNIGTVQDRSDADYIIRRIDRSQQRLNMGMSGT